MRVTIIPYCSDVRRTGKDARFVLKNRQQQSKKDIGGREKTL